MKALSIMNLALGVLNIAIGVALQDTTSLVVGGINIAVAILIMPSKPDENA